MEETLKTNIVLKRDGIEAAGEVGDSALCIENEEGMSISFVPECDSSKQCTDVGNTVSFAEDLEVSEMCHSSVKAGAVNSLHLPMHLIECKINAQIDQKKVQDNGLEPSELSFSRIADSVVGTEHLEVDQMSEEVKSAVTHYSFALVLSELASLETPTYKEGTECETLKKHKDVGKAVFFAEDLEVSEMSQSSVIADANSSLYLPMHLIGNTNRIHIDQHKIQGNGIYPSDLNSTGILDSCAVENHPIEDHTSDEVKPSVTHDSFVSVLPELDSFQTLTHKDGTDITSDHHPGDNEEDIITGNDPGDNDEDIITGNDHGDNDEDIITGNDPGNDPGDNDEDIITGNDPGDNDEDIITGNDPGDNDEDIITGNGPGDNDEDIITGNDPGDNDEDIITGNDPGDNDEAIITGNDPGDNDEDIITGNDPRDNDEDIITGNDQQIVQVNEGHKQFKVQNVDEAELVTNDETINASMADNKKSGCDACHLFSRALNILLDNTSPGTEINNQTLRLITSGIEPSDLGLSRIAHSVVGTQHHEVDQMSEDVESAVAHYSFALVLSELASLETLTHKEGTECEALKKHKDVGKAVFFAEDLEVSEMSKSSVIDDANSSLYFPMHLIDKNIDQHKVKGNGIDPSDLNSTVILDNCAVENHSKEDHMSDEVKPSLIHASFVSVLPELNTFETPTHKDSTDITSDQNPGDNEDIITGNDSGNDPGDNDEDIITGNDPGHNEEDIITGNDPQIVQVNEGHKEFKVQNVDEAELVTNNETVNASMADNKKSGCDACHLFSRSPNILLDNTSPGTEINNQDTIGPLDNPAFLRTLHYSVSLQPTIIQPVTKDELVAPKSNLDVRSHAILQNQPDLDQGWAWVVLFAGFLAYALLGATIYASGVLMLTILQEINPDLTKAAWVGSVFVCAMCLSGPFVEIALNQFGARMTVFCAGIVLTAGFVGASFANNISELILTHGVIAGVGAGFVANPVSVSVGQYFFRYRGLACGLLATGAGAGMLVGGTIISVLLDHYGLSGTYLIWGGVLFHTAVLGLLLRPSPEERLRALERDIGATESYHGFINRSNAVSGFNSLLGSANQSMISGIEKIGITKRTTGPQNLNTVNSGDPETDMLNADHCHEASHATETETTSHILPLSQVTTSQHPKFDQGLVLKDQQHSSLNNSLTAMPRTDNCHTVSACSHNTLINNVPNSPLYSSDYLLTTDPTYTSVTPCILSSLSRSTHGLEKSIHGRRFQGHNILSRVSCGDQEFHENKPTVYSSHSVTTHQSHSRSHVTSSNWCSRFSKSLGLAIRQYTSLSPSPFVTPKANSPPTVPSSSQHTLTNPHNSSSFFNAYTAATPDLTHANDVLTSVPSTPTSIHGPFAQSRIQRHRMSLASLSQHTSLSHISVPLSYRGSVQHSCAGEMDSESITSALISQLRHRDIMIQKYPVGSNSISTFMGSVGSIPTALAIVKDDVARYETYSIAGIPDKGLKGTGIKILDSMRLLRQKPFLMFLSVCFLWSFGESPVMIYLPSYAVSRGTSQMQASMLYTAMGTGSILGRFLSGLTATDSNIGPTILYSGCLGIAGLLVVLTPFITSTFMQQVIFSCLAGIYTGSLVPLSSLIAIDMLEIGKLGIGFGFISMAQGMGNLVGPPLASIFVGAYGYKNAFVFSGFALLSGSMLALLMSAYVRGTEEVELDEQLQKSHLENALKKISSTESKQENGFHCEENISKLNEMRENSRVMKQNGTPSESTRDMADCHEHYPKEEKLGTIMEIAGK